MTSTATADSAGTTGEDLRYPIGRLAKQERYTDAERAALVERMAGLPAALRDAVRGLTDEQLDTGYRPGGWTVRQLVHHIADSHMNAYIRVKLALTEDTPTIKPYDQDAWVRLADIAAVSPETSLSLVEGVHARLDPVLRSITPADAARRLVHPENGPMTVDSLIATYAWHGDHHVAHIRGLRQRMGW